MDFGIARLYISNFIFNLPNLMFTKLFVCIFIIQGKYV